MSRQQTLHALVVAALLVGLGFIALNFLRLAFITNIVHPFLLLNMAVLGGVVLVGLRYRRQVKLLPIEWGLLGSLALTALCTDYEGRHQADIVIDMLRPLLFIGTVASLRSLADVKAISASTVIRKLFAASVWVSVVAVVACYAINTAYHVLYPAYSTIDSVMGLGWLMATANPAAQFLYGLMLLLSGKRGVYIAAFFLFLILYRHHRRFILVSAAALILVVGALFSVSAENRIVMSAFFIKSYISSLRYEVSKPDFNARAYVADVVSGGRMEEVKDALRHMHSPLSPVVGEGFGFAYPSKQFAPDGSLHRNLHFTPLSLLVYYGVIFFALFSVYLAGVVRVAWLCLKDKSNPVMFTFAAYFLASLVFCLTEYNLFVYANVAISAGLLMAHARSKQLVSSNPQTV